jgi:SAM-dependent MidA family methyltransferase
MEKFENLEKFDDWEKARERAKQIKGVVISYSIDRDIDGKYIVIVCVEEVFDGLTDKVFVSENGKMVREVLVQDENVYYEDVDERHRDVEFVCDSFKEAKEKAVKIIEEIVENRKKVRQTKKEEYGCVVF